jgi:deoxyribodipyrimidine photo-lyase
MTQPVIMWFRQDLRLADNAAFAAAVKLGPVICIYILDDETPGKWWWGGASRWWLHNSLESLASDLAKHETRLVLRRGPCDKVLGELLDEADAQALHFTRDYSPWSPALEQRVKAIAESRGVTCKRFGGFLLREPEDIRTGQDEPYKVYTPFARAHRAAGDLKRPRPAPADITTWADTLQSDALDDWQLLPSKPDWAKGFTAIWTPGEQGAQASLKTFISKHLADYAEGRDRPDLTMTSRLSPHLHWGEISPLQCWHAVTSAMAKANGRLDGAGEKFLSELLWREFSYHLISHWPDLPHKPFRAEFAAFPWHSDKKGLRAWQRGQTGYPIVDAGMRELWATGFMHNRVRMIAASFLIKDLLIDWREGERWFWNTLVDADIANNAASWQWVAGSGADAAPYFRIFNPVLQGEKFDPDGNYARRWIPEIAHLPNSVIHKPWQSGDDVRDYPKPIVDHGIARDRALEALRQIKT